MPQLKHVPGWSTLGDQIGPVDIRGARPLHSGCCEAVLECASHAVDSRIFGSRNLQTQRNKKHKIRYSLCFFVFFLFFSQKKKKKEYACRDSNSGFPACEAGVITRLDHTRIELRNGESNPGHLRDRQRCYQLHHIGWLFCDLVTRTFAKKKKK